MNKASMLSIIFLLLTLMVICEMGYNEYIEEQDNQNAIYNKIVLNQDLITDQSYSYNEQDSDLRSEDLQYHNFMLHYSRQHFKPIQSFSFLLRGNQSYQFSIFPNRSDIFITGIYNNSNKFQEGKYYCQNGCVTLDIYEGDYIIRQYHRQKEHLFFFSHRDRDHRYTFSFKNNGNQTQSVNISYYYSSIYSTASRTKVLNISKVTSMFQRVNKIIKLQQVQLNNLIKIDNIQEIELQNHYYQSIWPLLIETLLISLGNFISLYALKKYLYNDYYPLHSEN